MNRRQFLAAAAAAPLLTAQSRRPPNIVFILLDDLGSGDFGCYGQKLIRTPHVDAFAKQGARYTDCYAGGVVCAPSRSVLMTGLHTGHTPIRANAGTIPLLATDVTIAKTLHDAGYATGGFGKWGLGDAGSAGAPEKHGFDEFFGYYHQVHAHTYYPEFLWDTGRKHPLSGTQYSANLIAERSREFVRKHKDRPFFLYACYTLPHGKYEVPDTRPYDDQPWTQGQKVFASMVTLADQHVGQLLGVLKELNLERDTIVFVTSDNGAPSGGDKGYELFRSNGALRGQKGDLYEGGIRAPMIVRWPGRIEAGRVSGYPWMFCDFAPTAMEIAGLKPRPGFDGLSVLPELLGKTPPKREFLYWESNLYDQKNGRMRADRLGQAVRMENWKAVKPNPSAPIELYDLKTDPTESKNVAAANPEIVARAGSLFTREHADPRPHNTGSMQWVK